MKKSDDSIIKFHIEYDDPSSGTFLGETLTITVQLNRLRKFKHQKTRTFSDKTIFGHLLFQKRFSKGSDIFVFLIFSFSKGQHFKLFSSFLDAWSDNNILQFQTFMVIKP